MKLLGCATACALLTVIASAQVFTLTRPRGARPGETLTLRVYGKGLSDLCGAIAFEPGLEFGAVKVERDDRATIELKVREDCALGRHLIALRTKRGISRAKVFAISPLPSISETRGPHADAEHAQAIALETTVEGRVLGEETDWFAVEVPAGTRLQVEIEAQRLADTDWDPTLEVRAPNGSLALEADDSALGRLDPIATVDCAVGGRWLIALRDVAARGSSLAAYRLHVGTWPRPLGSMPAAVAPGADAEVLLLGDGAPVATMLHGPATTGSFEWFPSVGGRVPPTPLIAIADLRPILVEGALPSEASVAGSTFHGVIAEPGEEDRFPLRVKKGERVDVSVLAQSLRSPLDPVLIVRDAEGKERASNDDGRGLDARLRFTAQADGVIWLCVRDQLGRGGDTFAYRVETGSPARLPSTSESVPGRRAEDFGVAVPIGGRAATLVAVDGLDAKDRVELGFCDLPSGVRVGAMPLQDGIVTVPLVFEAAGDATLAASLAHPRAQLVDGGAERAVEHRHEFPLLRVRNNEAVVNGSVAALPVAVVEPCPFAVDIDPPQLPLARTGSAVLSLRVRRDPECKSTLTLRPLWAPPGLSIATVTVPNGKGAASVAIAARANAMVGRFPLVLIASGDDRGVARSVSTEVFWLDVQEPWLEASISKAKIEQGGESTLRIDVRPRHEFEGEIVAQLGRLPAGVEAEFPPIPREGGAIDVKLRAKADAQVGRHRSIYVELAVVTAAGRVTHTFGGGEIRVDRPLPHRADRHAGGER